MTDTATHDTVAHDNGESADRRPLSGLVADAVAQASTLVREEAELARVELRHDVTAAKAGAIGFGVAGGGALLGGIFVCLAAMFGLAEAMPMWLAALIVGCVLLAGAGMFALAGRRALKEAGPPERTVR